MICIPPHKVHIATHIALDCRVIESKEQSASLAPSLPNFYEPSLPPRRHLRGLQKGGETVRLEEGNLWHRKHMTTSFCRKDERERRNKRSDLGRRLSSLTSQTKVGAFKNPYHIAGFLVALRQEIRTSYCAGKSRRIGGLKIQMRLRVFPHKTSTYVKECYVDKIRH